MATFTDDEFLVALDDLHAVDLGIKKLVAKMKELKPDWKDITAKVVREAVAVIRAPDGAAADAGLAHARGRVPEPTASRRTSGARGVLAAAAAYQ